MLSNLNCGILPPKTGGPNVYEGLAIDYKGADVNPETFLAVLKGDQEAVKSKGTGKVCRCLSVCKAGIAPFGSSQVLHNALLCWFLAGHCKYFRITCLRLLL